MKSDEEMSIKDFENDPRYQHLKDSDWLTSWQDRFSKDPVITVVPKRQPVERSLEDVLNETMSHISQGRPHQEKDVNLNRLASMWNAIGRKFDPSFSYNHHRELYRSMILWAVAHKDSKHDINRGLFLHGPIGTGKTLAMSILRIFLQITGQQEIVFDIHKADDIVDRIMTDGKFDAIRKLSFKHLFVDEVGQEKIQIQYFGNEVCVMEKVFMYAYDSHSRYRTYMHVSTNVDPSKFDILYGPRVYSRMQELFNFIYVKGDDFRTKK
jgi:DNA replication protein DnaC